VQIAATFGSTVIIVGLFEEVGWRGYALPRLQQRMTNLRAALVLGGIWAIWHLPELVSDPPGNGPWCRF
jgi:membrane protease YdiL (CAAX protease family)